MSSPNLSELVAPDGIDVLRSAVTDVAERSFFMAADPCGDDRLRDLVAAHDPWLVATVRFDEPSCRGVASYLLPHDLGRALFDAFNGRAPLDPPPTFDELFDVVGEFANMICG